jgi:hypothetical protein
LKSPQLRGDIDSDYILQIESEYSITFRRREHEMSSPVSILYSNALFSARILLKKSSPHRHISKRNFETRTLTRNRNRRANRHKIPFRKKILNVNLFSTYTLPLFYSRQKNTPYNGGGALDFETSISSTCVFEETPTWTYFKVRQSKAFLLETPAFSCFLNLEPLKRYIPFSGTEEYGIMLLKTHLL